MKRVLVLDANQRSALAVTRSLGKHGIPVITADETPSALAGSSRYSEKYLVYPSPLLYPEEFVLAILHTCKSNNIELILPMTELTTMLLLNNRNSFPEHALPFPDSYTVDRLADKYKLMQSAESLDIPVPNTFYIDNPANPQIDLQNLSYPVVLKPGKSWIEHEDKWLRTCVRTAGNSDEAAEILGSDPAFHLQPYMLQEFIPGKGEGIFALYNNGQPLAFFAHRRLREKPPEGGVSVLSESTPMDPRLASYARKLLDHAGWHGVAMVEFRVTPDGRPYLMEINTRFWGSLQLAVDAGVDFPWMLYQTASREQLDPIENYRTGIRLRWLLGDLDSLYLALRDSKLSMHQKLKAFAAFLTPSPGKTRHEVNRWGDLGPFRYELKQYLKDLLRKRH